MVIVLLLVLASTPADDAKKAYDKALRYSKAGEYEAALPYFQQAYELSKHRPSTIIALAQCEREVKMYEAAITHFKEYLALKPAPKDSKQIKETVGLLEELRAREVAKAEEERKNKESEQREISPPPPPPEIATALPPPPPVVPPAPPAVEEDSGGILESPVFWIVSAGVVVLAAGGVALGFALRPDAEIYGGTSGIVLGER